MIVIKTITTMKNGTTQEGYLLNCGKIVEFESKEIATMISLKLNLNFDSKLLDHGALGREYLKSVIIPEFKSEEILTVKYNKDMFLV